MLSAADILFITYQNCNHLTNNMTYKGNINESNNTSVRPGVRYKVFSRWQTSNRRRSKIIVAPKMSKISLQIDNFCMVTNIGNTPNIEAEEICCLVIGIMLSHI